MELGAIVEGERLEPVAMASDRARGCTRDLVLGASAELLDDRVAGLALHQREHAMTHVAAHDGITLPMTDALAS